MNSLILFPYLFLSLAFPLAVLFFSFFFICVCACCAYVRSSVRALKRKIIFTDRRANNESFPFQILCSAFSVQFSCISASAKSVFVGLCLCVCVHQNKSWMASLRTYKIVHSSFSICCFGYFNLFNVRGVCMKYISLG